MPGQNSAQALVDRLVAAYKLRLGEAAKSLKAEPETWGLTETISCEEEARRLGGEERYRLSPYPYPGLRSFDPQEGEIFFGREHNIKDVQNRLVTERMVVVLGGSGSGKSSLIRAGLLPYLNTKRRIPGRDGSWYKAEFRPRKDPLSELIDALVGQWLLPLLDLKLPDLSSAMGVPADASRDELRARLTSQMRARFFDGAKAKPREVIRDALLEIANRHLDDYDRIASGGLRVPGPSLMLLLDQFEEVFRPEVPPEARKLLLDLIVDLHKYWGSRSEKGGLFLAITMRSEELHRCGEHRGLSDVINRSFYLLDLLDPRDPDDRAELHQAIVRPARNVFEDWGLEYDLDCADAPFAQGMPDWLLAGAERSSNEVEHRPDQLPLLQHAVQAAWHAAMRRWSTGKLRSGRLLIERADLPGQVDAKAVAPDLGACLRERADKAADRAAERFEKLGRTSPGVGEKSMQAAFRALARRDDRGTWARRFAEPDDMLSFMAADPALRISGANRHRRLQALRNALHVFLLRGYLSGGDGRPYDISHEALIRNWPRFREWLREPEEVAYALNRVLVEVEPEKFEKGDDEMRMDLIPADVADKVALLGSERQLPRKWAEDQVAPALVKVALLQRWGDKEAALQKAVKFAANANSLRLRAREAKQQAMISRQRITFGSIAIALVSVILAVTYFDARAQRQKVEDQEKATAAVKEQAQTYQARVVALAADVTLSPRPPVGAADALVIALAKPKDLPDVFESDRVVYQALGDLREARRIDGLPAQVSGISFAPTKKLVAALSGNALYFWSTDGGDFIARVPFDAPPYTSIHWSPDGERLLIGSSSGASIFIPCGNEKLRGYFSLCKEKDKEDDKEKERVTDYNLQLGKPNNPGSQGAWSEDGKWILTGGFQREVKLFNAITGDFAKVWNPANKTFDLTRRTDQQLNAGVVAASPDGKRIAIASPQFEPGRIVQGGIVVLDAAEITAVDGTDRKEPVVLPPAAGGGTVFSLAFHPQDANVLLATYQNAEARLWRIDTKKWTELKDREPRRNEMPANRESGPANTQSKDPAVEKPSTWGSVYQGVFDPKGQFLVTASQDGVVRIWNLEDGTSQQEWPKRRTSILLRGHRSMVLSVDVAEDGTIASGSGDLTVRFWRRFSPLSSRLLGNRPVEFNWVEPLAEGRDVVVEQPDGKRFAGQLPAEFGKPVAGAISADGRTIVVAPVQGQPVLFAAERSEAPLRRLTGPSREWAGVAFLEGNSAVAAITKTGTAYTWPLFPKMDEVTELAKKTLPFVGSTKNRLVPDLPCSLKRINEAAIVDECD
jgi:WD40 repeat protein